MSDLVWFLEKSNLNPDLPYNRLLYRRFLLYILISESSNYSHDEYFRQHDFHLPHNDGRDDGRSPVQDSPLHEHDLQDARRRHGRHLGFRPEGILFNSTSDICLTFLRFNVQH